MSARKRRNRPGRQAPSRRPAVPASEPTPVEQAGEADIASVPVDEVEPQQGPQETGQESTAPEVQEPEVQETEAQGPEAQGAEERATEAAEPAPGDAAASSEAEEPESTASMARIEPEPTETAERETETAERETEAAASEPGPAEPEILEAEPADTAEGEPASADTAEREPETVETAESETEAAEPEPGAAVAAQLDDQPTEAETTVAASEPAQPLARALEGAEPEHAERAPEAGEPEAAELGPAAHDDREAEPEPDLRAEPEAAPERGFGEPELVEQPAVEPQAEAEVQAPPTTPTAATAPTTEPGKGAADREPAARNGWAVLYQMGKPRLTKANLFAAVLAVGLGFAVVAQVQQTQNAGLESLREDELVRILDDFTQENLRLGNEIRELESSRDRLISGAGTSSEALRAAQERADTLGILAGTRPARGEGIEMTIADPTGQITAPLLLDALEELRDAGAEAVQIGGIRVVASSYFTDVDGGIELSGQRLERPYTILAIGDSSTLASAMKIPGGVVDTVRGKDGITTITEKPQIDITALHVVRTPQYAQPVPSPTSS